MPVVPVADLGDAGDACVVQRLNAEVLHDSGTSQLSFGVRELVAHASSVFTLEPWDLILTGTTAGVGAFRQPPVSLRPGTRSRSKSRASASSGTRSSRSG